MSNSSLVQEGLKKSGDWKYETSAVRKSGIKFGGTKYMSFHIVADSCCELTADMKKRGNIEIAPLTLEVGGESILDDETFDQKYFLKRVAECPECPKSACPSPDYFRKSFLNGAERCYAVTLSAQLSGSYNSANLAKKLYAETNPFTKVEVIDSIDRRDPDCEKNRGVRGSRHEL